MSKVGKRPPKGGNGSNGGDGCFNLYEWSDFVGELGGYSYTGSNLDGVIGTFNTPVFDTPDVRAAGSGPVARLRGYYVTDPASGISTYTAAWYFIDQDDYLAYYAQFDSSGTQGVPVGGTGRWQNFRGYIGGGELLQGGGASSGSDGDSLPYIIYFTVCPAAS